MAQSVLTWTPAGGSNSASQSVQYRLKGASTWTTFSTETATVNTKTVTGLLDNEVYEFRIVNSCSVGGPTPSGVIEGIKITCPTDILTKTYDTVTATFSHLGGDIDKYDIKLYDNTPTLITTYTANSPFSSTVTHTFTGLIGSTIYQVKIVPYAGLISKTDCANVSVTTDAPPTCDIPTGVGATMS